MSVTCAGMPSVMVKKLSLSTSAMAKCLEKQLELVTITGEWNELPRYVVENPHSGVEAFHKVCYKKAPDWMKETHIISQLDPDQSMGRPRKKYS